MIRMHESTSDVSDTSSRPDLPEGFRESSLLLLKLRSSKVALAAAACTLCRPLYVALGEHARLLLFTRWFNLCANAAGMVWHFCWFLHKGAGPVSRPWACILIFC